MIVLVPGEALEATLTVREDVTLPPDGIGTGLGLKLEKVTPEGTEPVIDSVTEPE